MRLCPQPRAPLGGQRFDVVIIGGGINGVAIARECARGGRRTLLIEQNDFSSGTTSRSTRIIHGGLRYLEHGEVGLVRESLRERQRLLAECPHLVRPMAFVLALPPGRRSAMEVRFGLWLYRRFAGVKCRDVSAETLDRTLDRRGRPDSLRLFAYDDAQCEFPERLVAEWLCDALESWAIVRNHTSALTVPCSNGRVRGVLLRDQQHEYQVEATCVINATGPWADRFCSAAGVSTDKPMIGGVRGSHIVVPRFPGAPDVAIYTEAPDGRPVFCIPWNGQILFGTTEVRDNNDPGRAEPSSAEIGDLVSALHSLFPNSVAHDIAFAFSGVRPLPYAPGASMSAVTRRHFLHDHSSEGAAGLISVIGGKLTTAAPLARDCARKIGIAVPEPAHMAVVDDEVINSALDRVAHDVALIAGLELQDARALVGRHGARAVAVAHHIALDDRLREPLGQTRYLNGEATYAIQREAAVTLADVLLRRVPMALSAEWSGRETWNAARQLAPLIGWSEAQIHRQVEDFERERSAFLVRPAAVRLAA